MPFAYLLRCADGSLYAGSTRNLQQRLEQHASGAGAVCTSKRLPVSLERFMEFDNVGDAYRWERRLHDWSKAKKELLIAGAFGELSGWSQREQAARGKASSVPFGDRSVEVGEVSSTSLGDRIAPVPERSRGNQSGAPIPARQPSDR